MYAVTLDCGAASLVLIIAASLYVFTRWLQSRLVRWLVPDEETDFS